MPTRLFAPVIAVLLSCSPQPSPTVDPEPVASPPVPTPRPSRSRARPGRAASRNQAADRETGKLVGLTAAHNRVRAGVGVAPLSWSNALADVAQRWADHLAARGCELEHSHSDAYGENLFWSSNGSTAAAVVDSWVAERAGYDHAKNRCRGVCGHYTQVVWRGTAKLGCGIARCGDAELWVCNYDPPGNFIGESPY